MANDGLQNRLMFKLESGGKFMAYLFAQFQLNRGSLSAAALTYTTLFAVVPLMTVTYAMLSSIPSFDGVESQLQDLIFNHFIPSSGAAVQDYFGQFTSQARTLTAVGVAFLVVTAFMMLKTIEATFNRIWRVKQPRRGLASFLLYWAVLSLGPLLLGLGFALTSYVVSLPLVSDATALVDGKIEVLKLLPILLSTAAFTLIYVAVPNCPVVARHAFAGGLAVALMFEAAKQGFTLFVSYSPSYELIYGAFAAVPLFLAWIFISWLIILLGAELVRALSTFTTATAFDQASGGQHLSRVLQLLEQLWQAQRSGGSVSQLSLLKQCPELSVGDCDVYLSRLLSAAIIMRTEQGDFILAKDLHALNLQQLCDAMPWKLPADMSLDADRDWLSDVDQRLQKIAEFRSQQLAVDLASVFAETERLAHQVGDGRAD